MKKDCLYYLLSTMSGSDGAKHSEIELRSYGTLDMCANRDNESGLATENTHRICFMLPKRQAFTSARVVGPVVQERNFLHDSSSRDNVYRTTRVRFERFIATFWVWLAVSETLTSSRRRIQGWKHEMNAGYCASPTQRASDFVIVRKV